MYRFALILSVCLVGIPAEGGLKVRPFRHRYVHWYRQDCPTTLKRWRHVRYSIARDFSDLSQKRAPFGNYRERGADRAYRWLDRCFTRPKILDLLEKEPQLVRCLRPLQKYLSYYKNFYPRHAGKDGISRYGFNVSDELYNKAATKYTPVPEELQDPIFLEYLNRLENLPKAFKYLYRKREKRINDKLTPFEFVFFESRIPADDRTGTKARLLVYYPDGPTGPERFFQFSLPDPSNRKSEEVVSLSLTDKGAYFYEYWRRRKKRIYGLEQYRELKRGRCIACHRSGGPLAIHPAGESQVYKKTHNAYSFWGNKKDIIEKLNRRILRLGRQHSRFDESSNIEMGLGSIDSRRRTDALLDFCMYRTLKRVLRKIPKRARVAEAANVRRRIRESMSCSRCHDGTNRSVLAPPFEFTIKHFVQSGQMPPENELRPFERELLGKCLQAEFWGYTDPRTKRYVPGTLFDYLTSESCISGSRERIRPIEGPFED